MILELEGDILEVMGSEGRLVGSTAVGSGWQSNSLEWYLARSVFTIMEKKPNPKITQYCNKFLL